MDEVYDIPVKKLDGKRIPFDALKYIPQQSSAHYQFIPLSIQDGVLEVGMVDPEDSEARDALLFIASKNHIPFKIYLISKADFDLAIKSYEGISGEINKSLGDLQGDIEAAEESVSIYKKEEELPKANIVEEAPVTKIVSVILQHAASGNASDIHIEPMPDKVKVRFRVDGILYTSLFLPITVHEAIVARVKILTNVMKLDEKRKPQDGRFSAMVEGKKVDFRVSTFPTYFGEKVVMRILDPAKKLVNLASLGLDEEQSAIIRRSITRPYGLVLITGPTGSGKTTTLYSMLSELEKEKFNVVSLEDPIEYDIAGVSQSQVHPEINYTFANGLRSILRQDPDIIMVGEIRDKETAKLAIQASLTGHLVLSTLHTNSAIGVVPRLIDMGVEPYLIPPTLVLAIGQRLVPILCEDAKTPVSTSGSIDMMVEKQFADLPEEFRSKLPLGKTVYHAGKSPSCPSGTKGRMGVFEFLEMDRELERIILNNPGESEIYRYARSKGFVSMKEDAIIKAFKGVISFEEVNKL